MLRDTYRHTKRLNRNRGPERDTTAWYLPVQISRRLWKHNLRQTIASLSGIDVTGGRGALKGVMQSPELMVFGSTQ